MLGRAPSEERLGACTHGQLHSLPVVSPGKQDEGMCRVSPECGIMACSLGSDKALLRVGAREGRRNTDRKDQFEKKEKKTAAGNFPKWKKEENPLVKGDGVRSRRNNMKSRVTSIKLGNMEVKNLTS